MDLIELFFHYGLSVFKIDFIWLGLQTVNDDEPETWRDLVWDFSKVTRA